MRAISFTDPEPLTPDPHYRMEQVVPADWAPVRWTMHVDFSEFAKSTELCAKAHG